MPNTWKTPQQTYLIEGESYPALFDHGIAHPEKEKERIINGFEYLEVNQSGQVVKTYKLVQYALDSHQYVYMHKVLGDKLLEYYYDENWGFCGKTIQKILMENLEPVAELPFDVKKITESYQS